MPNMRHRVNSLTEEHEENMQMSKLTGHLSSISTLFPVKNDASQTLTLGQLGLGCPCQLVSLWHYLRKNSPSRAVNIKIFESQFDALADFNLKLASLTSPDPRLPRDDEQSTMVEALLRADIVAIEGCQRLIFDDGRVILDIYLGDTLSQLKCILPTSVKGDMTDNSALIAHWNITEKVKAGSLDQAMLWQIAKLSRDNAALSFTDPESKETRQMMALARSVGLRTLETTVSETTVPETQQQTENKNLDTASDAIPLQERRALRHAQSDKFQYCPVSAANEGDEDCDGEIAIIGGGVASTHLALSLAQRNKKVRIFCSDANFAQQASGNKQGAVYPLLTPDNGHLSHYFQQGYLFTRRRLQALVDDKFAVSYDFCGVLQTGFDDRSSARLDKIINGQSWNEKMAYPIDAASATQIAGIDIDKAGIYYPLGGWICPHEFTRAAFDKAARLSDVSVEFNADITRIEQREGLWYLYKSVNVQHSCTDSHTPDDSEELEIGPFANLVLANGQGLTQFKQSEKLPATGFRGQVSHIPSRNALTKLSTVLCSHGYLTPGNNNFHCTGASYVKNPTNLDYCATEQVENLHKIRHSYVDKPWTEDVDITGHSARVGVRMVTRDHAPMMGCAPDTDSMLAQYEQHQHTKESIKFWKETPAPTHKGLFILGGLGSRGLTSGPLAAEALAAQLCGEVIPLSMPMLEMLNPNRFWMRKLIKGKAL
ncbi:FAD dependent oxidoreductase [Shewanella sediminis HAW-EB3]|uniref:tRNA 5-methylaminomethyl-2-thiouridine biosynthesis bifunctional protein MnmC n=2 Tax=Shewanella sediminis TaxID=271097 RepID=MNMC_SHESH|nr:RecName: Full=tRNA 5-methylaminomethyl-2-thiouridine biosynthesis bifunctional protein MnmC; Short=tRNA mnm(5)s(2)U biosynthesis bifunctional protein; Includes: RecName: Full=tRNA (mnm(5)s(2)U34)-methyltransferase; Includes: RecName: Full=FAD-dependent cmnm(5)s(2)U34 oxidoreductase [Shewanella sediminis HAW-EB3]ABV36254.1 FAD dependent oxidoreductase [Shewanella sediminis HAW-EB3]